MRLVCVVAAASLVVLLTVVPTAAQTAAQQPAAAQPPVRDNAAARAGTASIRGRVAAAETGTPLRRVQVRLTGGSFTAATAPRTVTDPQGRYEFRNVPAGRYTLSASKTGYLTLSYGQRRPLETVRPIEVADAQALNAVDFSLPRGSVIVTRVIDEFGEPVAGAGVSLHQYLFGGAGERRLYVNSFGNAYQRTNDRGETRLYGIPPGDYYVSTFVGAPAGSSHTLGSNDSSRIHAATYYPGTASFYEATRVTLGVGQEVNVTIPLVALRAARVSGVVRNSENRPPSPRSQATLILRAPARAFGPVAIEADGTFTFPNMLPGAYALSVTTPAAAADPAQAAEYGSMLITIAGADVSGLMVTTARGATVRGRFVFDAEPPRDLRPASLQPILAGRPVTSDDWTFEIADVSIGVVSRNAAGGWFLKAVMFEGRDVTDMTMDFMGGREFSGFEIVLTQKRTEVSGGVVDGRSAPVSDYVAVVFSAERERRTSSRFVAAGRPDQQGRFTIVGLPPGRYLATAVEYLEEFQEKNRETLERLVEKAIPLTLTEGESKTITLTLTPTP